MLNTQELTQRLSDEAKSVLRIMQRQARRAIVLEITGTPKAGKTTSVTTLKSFFKECGYRVHLLKERAADCPLPMKGHFFFNTWTTCTMMAEVLATVDTDVDLIILDRGFFDALVWLELQCRRGQITNEEKDVFSRFVTLERWRSLVDVTVAMKVAPEKAVERENLNLIVPRTGSVMNREALTEFNAALTAVRTNYKDFFDVIEFDSSSDSVIGANTSLVEKLLPKFRAWADPRIAVLPRGAVHDVFGKSMAIRVPDAKEDWAKLRPQIVTMKRSEAEDRDEWVQLIACGVQTNDSGGVFVFDRSRQDPKSTGYGKQVLWKGCHVEADGAPDLDTLARGLVQRIRQDLHLAVDLGPQWMGIIWDEQFERFHLGFMFKVPIESGDVARSMQEKEFRRSGRRYPTMTGTFQSPAALLEASSDLEQWSVRLLNEIMVAS